MTLKELMDKDDELTKDFLRNILAWVDNSKAILKEKLKNMEKIKYLLLK